MSRFGKQGVRCDWCGKIANNQNGEYTRPDGVSAGYIHQPDWDKEGPKDICEECAEARCPFCGSDALEAGDVGVTCGDCGKKLGMG